MERVTVTISTDKPVSVRITPTKSHEERLLDALFGAVKGNEAVKGKEGGGHVVRYGKARKSTSV